MGASQGRLRDADRRGDRAHRGALHAAAATSALPDRDLTSSARKPGVRRAWLKRNVHRAPGAGLRRGDALAEEDRRAAGRRHLGADGGDRRSRRPLFLRRAARVRTSRTWCSPTCGRPADVGLWARARALGLATPNVGLLTNIIACPGGDFCCARERQVDPGGRGDPAPPSTTSTTCTTSASSTSTSPAA
mgnify:CR=1 FL=1